MSCSPHIQKIISPEQIDVRGFMVTKAVRVTAFGLSGTDTVTFQRVQYCSEQPGFERKGCSLFEPEPAHIASAVDYQIGECLPSLTPRRNTLIIPYAGSYVPVRHGNASADLVVEVEPVEGVQFDDKEKGIVPCGFIIDEPPPPTYSASVPLVMGLNGADCPAFIGYLFHPNEQRDPQATVAIADCNGTVYGYAYPTAGEGHTFPIMECGNQVVGYAVNRSETAPQPYGGTLCR